MLDMKNLGGVVAGVLHHAMLQYPNQAPLFTTVYAFVLSNAIYLGLLCNAQRDLLSHGLELLKVMTIFNFLYVLEMLVHH